MVVLLVLVTLFGGLTTIWCMKREERFILSHSYRVSPFYHGEWGWGDSAEQLTTHWDGQDKEREKRGEKKRGEMGWDRWKDEIFC